MQRLESNDLKWDGLIEMGGGRSCRVYGRNGCIVLVLFFQTQTSFVDHSNVSSGVGVVVRDTASHLTECGGHCRLPITLSFVAKVSSSMYLVVLDSRG